MYWEIWRISSSFMPRVVMAGVPKRMPDGSSGGRGSSGSMFMLRVIPTLSRVVWAVFPGMPNDSMTLPIIRWFSVPLV